MKKIIFAFFHYLGLPFVFVSLLLNILFLKKKAKKYSKNPSSYFVKDRYRIANKISKKILFVKKVKTFDNGFESIPKKPVLYICNHKSHIDPFVVIKTLSKYLPELPYFCFIAKDELQKSKFSKSFGQLIDTIFLKREDLRSIYASFIEQQNTIKEGRSLVIFIEGTRIYEHKLGEFKSTALKIAYRQLLDIVPITMYGSSGLLFDKNKRYREKKKQVYLSINKIWKPNMYANVDINFLSDNIKEQMEIEYCRIKKCLENKKEIFLSKNI